jgi:hypothetical protein
LKIQDLYPYKAEFNIEHGKDFIRTENLRVIIFSIIQSKGPGPSVFAGKFFYLGSQTYTKQFATDRYHLI